MIYDLNKQTELDEALEYIGKLSGQHALVEIKKKSPKRSLNQNAYLHLIIAIFGSHFGYNLEEAKIIYKEINKHIYLYKKKNREFYRSSATLDVTQMAKSIDHFMEVSARNGCELPPATSKEWLRSMQNELERSGYYDRV